MTSPYLLLVTGSLRSNRSRAKCTAQVGMSYRLIASFHDNGGIREYQAHPDLLKVLVCWVRYGYRLSPR